MSPDGDVIHEAALTEGALGWRGLEQGSSRAFGCFSNEKKKYTQRGKGCASNTQVREDTPNLDPQSNVKPGAFIGSSCWGQQCGGEKLLKESSSKLRGPHPPLVAPHLPPPHPVPEFFHWMAPKPAAASESPGDRVKPSNSQATCLALPLQIGWSCSWNP